MEEEKVADDEAPGACPPGTGLFGVLRPGSQNEKAYETPGPTLKLEVLGNCCTWFLLGTAWFITALCILYLLAASQQNMLPTFYAPPAQSVEAIWGITPEDATSVANYPPFTDPAETELFHFTGAATVLPPNISVTAADGAAFTALQWFGANADGVTPPRANWWDCWMEYRDDGGISLSGDRISFQVEAWGCTGSCQEAEDWREIFSDPAVYRQQVRTLKKNENGVPTKVEWSLIYYQQFVATREKPCFVFKYLSDPGAGDYRVFADNGGGFGSCGGDDGDDGQDNTCMALKMQYGESLDYTWKNLALLCIFLSTSSTVVFMVKVHRSKSGGWRNSTIQQKWTLLQAFGTILFQNPFQSIAVYFDPVGSHPTLYRALESITSAGLIIILLVAALWADSARRRILSTAQFYGPKVLYVLATLATLNMMGFALYPGPAADEHNEGYYYASSVWSWATSRAALMAVAGAARLFLWLVGGLYYYYYLHRSFKFYNRMPYMLTRTEQLSFRFYSFSFSFFVFYLALRTLGGFAGAVYWAAGENNHPETTMLLRVAAFFHFLNSWTQHSPFGMLIVTTALLIFEYVFLPPGHYKHTITHVRLERDLKRAIWRSGRAQPFLATSRRMLGIGGGGSNGHGDGASAAKRGRERQAAADSAPAAAPTKPPFVIERARWLADIARQAYRCFTPEELAGRAGASSAMVEVGHLGCDIVAKITEDPEDNLHDTHCLVLRHRATRRLIVAFRGTISKKQMKTDLQATRVHINLDQFVLKASKKSMNAMSEAEAAAAAAGGKTSTTAPIDTSGAAVSGSAPGEQVEVATSDEEQGEGTTRAENGGVTSSVPPAGYSFPNLKGKSTRSTRSHMAAEGSLPNFLRDLASIGTLGVDAAANATAAAAVAIDAIEEHVHGDHVHAATAAASAAAAPAASAHGGGAAAAVAASVGNDGEPKGPAAATAAGPVQAAQRLKERAAALHQGRLESKRQRGRWGRVHYGFYSSYSTIRGRVLAVVQRELMREPGQLYLTGHSLGGALCTVCAYDIALWLLPVVNAQLDREVDSTGEEHEEEIKITLYNFGSPRVGDLFFARRFDAAVPHAYRVVCDGDIITGLPPARFGYMHVGSQVVVDRTGSGSLLIDPGVIERSLKTRSNRSVAAHLFNLYMKALDGCLYPEGTPDDVESVVTAVYSGSRGGYWYSCCCFYLCYGNLPRWCGCGRCCCCDRNEGENRMKLKGELSTGFDGEEDGFYPDATRGAASRTEVITSAPSK